MPMTWILWIVLITPVSISQYSIPGGYDQAQCKSFADTVQQSLDKQHTAAITARFACLDTTKRDSTNSKGKSS